MSETPLVSIRCIVYNHAPFLRQSLDGFVMQRTTFPFEAIVHDDASTDGSTDIIREYAEKYPHIIKPIIQTENQYSKHDGTITRLLDEACKGKYLANCEGDDYWTDPDKLQKQVDFLESHPDYTMCCCEHELYSERLKGFVARKMSDKDATLKPEDIIKEGGLYIATCGLLYHSTIRDAYTDYMRKCHVGDYPLQIMCAMKGKVYRFAKPMCVYRIDNAASWSSRKSEYDVNKKVNKLTTEVNMLKGFSNDYPEHNKAFADRLAYFLVYNIPEWGKWHSPNNDLYLKAFEAEFKEMSLKWRLYRLFNYSKRVLLKPLSHMRSK